MDRSIVSGAVIVLFLLLAFAFMASYSATGHAYWMILGLVTLALSTITGAGTKSATS
jgi:hypothetical protein